MSDPFVHGHAPRASSAGNDTDVSSPAPKPADASGASFSTSLRTIIGLTRGDLDAAASSFWAHPDLAKLYPKYLIYLYASVRASVSVLKMAWAEARRLAPLDPVCEGIEPYLGRHIVEESGHEDWIVEDLEVLGISAQELAQSIPSPTIAAMVGAQYYWVLHCHPVVLLGYLVMIEGDPPNAPALEARARSRGISIAAFRTLMRHAALDQHHRDELYELLDHLPLTERQKILIRMNACRTSKSIAIEFEELIRQPGSHSP